MIARPVTDDGRNFAAWVQALKGSPGAYAIAQDGRWLYVGSSVGDLYGTLTRHFQQWQRRQSKAPTGHVFDRNAVAVAVAVTNDAQSARSTEEAWIAQLQPELNEQGLFRQAPDEATDAEEPTGALDELMDFFEDLAK